METENTTNKKNTNAGMLNSVTGDRSSKRVMGVAYLTIALILAIFDQFTKYDINSYEVWVGIVVTGAGLLGLGLFEYFGKIAKPGLNPPSSDK